MNSYLWRFLIKVKTLIALEIQQQQQDIHWLDYRPDKLIEIVNFPLCLMFSTI